MISPPVGGFFSSSFLQVCRIRVKSVFSARGIMAVMFHKSSFGIRVTLPEPVLCSLLSGLEPGFPSYCGFR